MNAMLTMVARLLLTILCLGFVVMMHEFGHFLMARRLGVRVDRFTIGFGPEIFGWTYGDTRYALCIIPLGGMVKLAGDMLEEHTKRPDEFFSQAWYRRIAIALAGPAMNYVLAYVLFVICALSWGVMKASDQPVVGDLVAGLPAARAGLKPGDRILNVDGVPMLTWIQLADTIHKKPGQKLELNVDRVPTDGAAHKPTVLFLTTERESEHGIGLIGIMPEVTKVRAGLGDSLASAGRDLKAWTMQPLRYLTTKIRHFESPKELSGPLGIAQMVTKASKEGFSYVIYLIAIISTGLGLFNLFPIPVLDGGHVFLYAIEGLIRRPLSPRVMQVANAVGLSFVLTIFVYASFQDIARLGMWK